MPGVGMGIVVGEWIFPNPRSHDPPQNIPIRKIWLRQNSKFYPGQKIFQGRPGHFTVINIDPNKWYVPGHLFEDILPVETGERWLIPSQAFSFLAGGRFRDDFARLARSADEDDMIRVAGDVEMNMTSGVADIPEDLPVDTFGQGLIWPRIISDPHDFCSVPLDKQSAIGNVEIGSDHANMLNIKCLSPKYGLISVLGAFLGVKKRF